MEQKCFMFELVVLNVWVPNFDYENNTLTVEVNFNDTEFTIEPNPEKTGEFKQGRVCELTAYPDELRNELLDRPLKLKVKTNDDEVKGEAEIPWPQELLDKLETEQFVQCNRFEQCEIWLDNMSTGNIGIQYRLRTKCELSESEDNEEENHVDIQNELKKIVNPNEVFFLIQNDSDECSVMKADSNKTCPSLPALDLSRFKNFHGKVVRNTGVFDQVYSLDCCHTKKYTPSGEWKRAFGCVDSNHHNPEYGKDLTCEESGSSVQWACQAKKHVRECPHSNKFSDETIGSCSCDCGDPKNNNCSNRKMKTPCHYPESPPVLKETVYIRPKLCPICNSDVSWLPKMAACPKCGHKPVPYAVERPYNDNLTADQILDEWSVSNPKKSTNSEKVLKRGNRCSCANGKICAYCRIRKLCKDILKTTKCSDKNVKEYACNEMAADEICKSANESESRTYLAKVFSELRDLYNLKNDIAKRKFGSNKPCEKVFAELKSAKSVDIARPITSNVRRKEQTDLTKNLAPDVKAKWCKGKLYNYKAIRKYPGTSVGHSHRACVASGKAVPHNMGWLWSTTAVGNRRGWKPGAIRKPIKEIMKYFLRDYPVDSLRVSKYSRNKVVKKPSEELVQKPTLQISKKNGVYTITMRPLKDASMLKCCADPYVAMKPIRFKIVKNPLMVYTSRMKKQLKKQFHKCTCHRPVSACYCRTYLDKKRLEYELNKACRQKGIPSLKDKLVLSDTTDSEAEFEFGVTPPAGLIKPQLKHKPDLACRETQYNEKDWTINPVFATNLNKYMKPYDVSGGRMFGGGAALAGSGKQGDSGAARISTGGGARKGTARGGRIGDSGGRSVGAKDRRAVGTDGAGFTGGAAISAGGGRGGGDGRAGVSGRAGFVGSRGGGDGRPHVGIDGRGGGGGIGGVGGWGGAGGNIQRQYNIASGNIVAGRVRPSGVRASNPTPLFCNLARRRKAETISYCPAPGVPCIPSC